MFVIERNDPSAAQIDFSFSKTVFAVLCVSGKISRHFRPVVMIEPAKSRLGGEVFVFDVIKRVFELTVMAMNSDLADLIHSVAHELC